MKHFLHFLSIFLFSHTLFSQCPAPEIVDWHFTSSSNVDIVFNAPENAESYLFIFKALYTNSGSMPGTAEMSFTGAAVAGINSVSINPTQILDFTVTAARYFYKVSLITPCVNNVLSDTVNFYVSPYSMYNNPGFNCGENKFAPMALLPDNGGDPYLYTFELDESSAPEVISNLGVLVDIGHTYNADLSISLISPAGTEVYLIDNPNDLGNTSGLSMYFADNGADQNGQNQYGIFKPAQSLSAFEGESPVGMWTLSVIDNVENNYGLLYGLCLNFGNAPCAYSVSGLTFYDLNGNGQKEQSEPVFPYAHIRDINSGTDFYSNADGKYFRCLSEGNIILEVLNAPEYYSTSPASLSPDLYQGGYGQALNFAFSPLEGIVDLQLKIWQVEPVEPNQPGKFLVEYKNIGTACTSGVEFEVVLSESLWVTDVNMGGLTMSGNTAQFSNSDNICPFESRQFEISYDTFAGLIPGTVLLSEVSVTGVGEGFADQNPINNSVIHQSVVSTDTDLNFKSVHTDTITSWFVMSNQSIDYLIHFQNNTSSTVQEIRISDQFDPKLDLSTFKIESVSLPLEIEQEGNLITFKMSDVALPPSANGEEDSRGFIRYSIQPKSSISAGEVIENTAQLYYDMLPPASLNTVTTLFIESTGLNTYDFKASVHPNPASNQLHVLFPANVIIRSVTVYDISGKKIETYNSRGSDRLTIDISAYKPGAYFLLFKSDSLINPVLWMKE